MVLSDGGTVHLRPIVPERRRRADSPSTGGCPSGPATSATSAPTRRFRRATWSASPPSTTTTGWPSSLCWVTTSSLSLGTSVLTRGRPPRSRSSSRTRTRVAGSGPILLEHLAAAARESGHRHGSSPRCSPRTPPWSGLPGRRVPGLSPRVRGGRLPPGVRDRAHRGVAWRSLGLGSRPPRLAASHNLLHPRSVAVDRCFHRPGQDRLRGARQPAAGRLRRSGLPGQRRASRPCAGCAPTPSVLDIPDDVDLAVVAVPAASSTR